MTKEEFKEALEKIGWSIADSGNGLNDFIINTNIKSIPMEGG